MPYFYIESKPIIRAIESITPQLHQLNDPINEATNTVNGVPLDHPNLRTNEDELKEFVIRYYEELVLMINTRLALLKEGPFEEGDFRFDHETVTS